MYISQHSLLCSVVNPDSELSPGSGSGITCLGSSWTLNFCLDPNPELVSQLDPDPEEIIPDSQQGSHDDLLPPVECVRVHDAGDGDGGATQEIILGPVVKIKHLNILHFLAFDVQQGSPLSGGRGQPFRGKHGQNGRLASQSGESMVRIVVQLTNQGKAW